MNTVKKNYSQEEISMAEMAKSLAHPARITILKILAQNQNLYDINWREITHISPATLIQHFKEMKKDHLVIGSIVDGKTQYRINWERIEMIQAQFGDLGLILKR